MDDKKLKEMAEFEDKNEATVISPNLIRRLAGHDGTERLPGEGCDFVGTKKQQYFYVVLQNENGQIVDIKHYTDYDTALLYGMGKSKETGTQWSVFSLNGRFVDGNFVGQ